MSSKERNDRNCPNCYKELSFSLKKQLLGNNCDCGFPNENQRTIRYRIYNWLRWRI